MYNALTAMRKVVKKYEYKTDENRQPLHDLIQAAFPYMQQLMTHLQSQNSLEAAHVMRVCLKIFWSCVIYQLPNAPGMDVNLWFQLVAAIINKRLPEASEGIEPLHQPVPFEERKSWPWWKVLFLNSISNASKSGLHN